jgi:hypothetical protein
MAEISGVVRFPGRPPRRKSIRMAELPQPFWSDDLVIGERGQVRWAVVRVTRGLEGRTFVETPPEVRMDIQGLRFVPHVLAVRAGQAVPFQNLEAELHHVHPIDAEPAFRPPGVRVFARPGFTRVRCDIHPWMSAWIAAFDHPFFAVTDDDGRFTIRGLPPGRYTLEVWHETLQAAPVEITVEGNATIPDILMVPG